MFVHMVYRFGKFTAVLVLGLVLLSYEGSLQALPLGTRFVRLDSSVIGANTSYIFSHQIPTSSLVGSTVFEFCANNPFIYDVCLPPTGINVSGANLDSESGDTGYTVAAVTTASRLVISRTTTNSTIGISQYVFSNIINPSVVGTVYARVTLHASTDGTGPYGDGGSVVFSINRQLSTVAFVPPYLTFCVGVTVTADCSSASGSSIDFGELSKTKANVAASQFAGATNDYTGFFTNLFATTMTSGNQIIDPLTTATASSPGTSQFGLNVRANNNPVIGQDPVGAGTSTPTPDYALPNKFILKSGVVTSSPISTDFNVFTVSYLVNVAPSQMPGIYNTTLTYVATASF